MTKLYVAPRFNRPDDGSHGGIRRVVDAQVAMLPDYGFDIVDVPQMADILAIHAGSGEPPMTTDQFLVAHCHGLYWSEYKWGRWADQVNVNVISSLRAANAVTSPSEWVAQVLRRGMVLSPYVVNHGVDCDEWQPVSDRAGYVLWNKARMDNVSDPTPMNRLAELCPDTRFVSTLGLPTSNVNVVGLVPYTQEHKLVSNAGVYLSTTRETFGIGVLEALACGVPVLGWDYGAQREYVVHKEHGWLAPVGDYDSLREGLRYIQSRDLSASCIELAKQFTWRKAIEQYASIYSGLSWPEVKVTVLVTTYNIEKYIGQCLESVLAQDFKDYELIVVDDCSTDNSSGVAQGVLTQFGENARVYRTPTNLKPPGAFNYGLERARGRYVTILDGDNILEPGALATLSSVLDQRRDLDIVYGRVRFINEDGTLAVDVTKTADGISGWPREFDFEGQLQHKNQIPSTCMYRRAIYDRVGGYRHRAPPAEDADFWCRAVGASGARAAKVTDAVTFTYRMRGDSMSHTHKDWPWHRWYPNWDTEPPFGASKPNWRPIVPTYGTDSAPKVSIIIPCGPGHEKYLPDALDSVYIQTMKEWECIVINDTGAPLKLMPSWVRIVQTDRASNGVSAARNLGLEFARGQAVVFLDADDYLNYLALAKMWLYYTKYGGYVYCDLKHIEEDRVIQTPDVACADILKMLPHPITGMYPNNGIRFDATMTFGEDWEYVAAVHAAGYCGTRVPDPLINYRTSSGNNRTLLLAHADEIRKYIGDRWGSMAGCGCGKGSGVAVAAQARAQANGHVAALDAPVGAEDMLLLEFTGTQDSITYRGKSSGTNYRFGIDSGHKVKYVYRADAEQLLQREEFRLAQVDS